MIYLGYILMFMLLIFIGMLAIGIPIYLALGILDKIQDLFM